MNENKKTEEFGAMIGGVIIILILIVGAFYFAGQRIQKSKEFQASLNNAGITATSTASSSDDLSSIENDANSMDLNNLGSGINNL